MLKNNCSPLSNHWYQSEWLGFYFLLHNHVPRTHHRHTNKMLGSSVQSRFISSSQKKINNFRLSSLCYYNSLLKRYITKKISANAGDMGSTPGSGRSPGEGTDNPLQYSCLGNPRDRRSLAGYSPWGHKSWIQLSK